MFWNTSSRRTPTMCRQRAMRSAQVLRSFCVWAMATGVPVVPLEQCRRTRSALSTMTSPRGYCERKSSLVVKGMRSMSSRLFMLSGLTPASSRRFL